MLIHIERVIVKSGKKAETAPIGWTMAGRAFVIRNRKELVDKWLPLFFRHGKFQSFTRKLYRWGFRQVAIPKQVAENTKELVFASPHFQRDNRELMVHMKSVTAAGLRRDQQLEQQLQEDAISEGAKLPSSAALAGQASSFASLLNNAAPPAAPLLRESSALLTPQGIASFAFSGQQQQAAQSLSAVHPLVQQLLLNQQQQRQQRQIQDNLVMNHFLQQLQISQHHQAAAAATTAGLPGLLAAPAVQESPLQLPSTTTTTPADPLQQLLQSLVGNTTNATPATRAAAAAIQLQTASNSRSNVSEPDRQLLEVLAQNFLGNLPPSSQSPPDASSN